MSTVVSPKAPGRATQAPQLGVLNVGVIALVVAVLVSVVSRNTADVTQIGFFPMAMALVALAVGIPHGAIDTLTLESGLSTQRRWLLRFLYFGVAAMSAAVIITWPAIAFVLVLMMTVWHFGSGDLEATGELRKLAPMHGPQRFVYALALGSAPVLLPLTSPAAVATVVAIEPALATLMTPTVLLTTRIAVLVLVVVAILWRINGGDLRGAGELFGLAILGIFVSPLLAFAVYFGFWHALRHTARLAQSTTGGVNLRSVIQVSRGGIPSLVGFLIVVALLATFVEPTHAVGPMLWLGLVIIWGLTVPHMLFVARFDARMRRSREASLRDASTFA